MTVFALAGFTSIGGRSPSFLIPFFTSKESNEVFAQELDEHFRIRSFELFNPDHYEMVRFAPPPIPREIGRLGLLACRFELDKVIFSEASKFKRTLELKSFDKTEAAFFNLERCLLLGELGGLKKAIVFASERFEALVTQQVWANVENKVSARRGYDLSVEVAEPTSAAEVVGEQLSALQHSLSSSEWFHRWLTQWNRSLGARNKDGLREDLIQIAIEWISSVAASSVEIPTILFLILREPPLAGRRNVSESAIVWLHQRMFSSPRWGQIWLAVSSKKRFDLDLLADGLGYLEHGLIAEKVADSRGWVKVWRKLRARAPDLEMEMIKLAYRAIPILRGHSYFIKKLIIPLVSSLDGQQSSAFREELYRWLVSSSRQQTNLWAEAFVRIAATEMIVPELGEMALAWLANNTTSNRWLDVWKIVEKRIVGSEYLIALAHEWLERADPQMKIWPDVITIILERSPTDYEIDLAKRWLDSHVDELHTPRYGRLAELVKQKISRSNIASPMVTTYI